MPLPWICRIFCVAIDHQGPVRQSAFALLLQGGIPSAKRVRIIQFDLSKRKTRPRFEYRQSLLLIQPLLLP